MWVFTAGSLPAPLPVCEPLLHVPVLRSTLADLLHWAAKVWQVSHSNVSTGFSQLINHPLCQPMI